MLNAKLSKVVHEYVKIWNFLSELTKIMMNCVGGMPSYAEKTFGSFKKWTNEMVDLSACESVVFLEVF